MGQSLSVYIDCIKFKKNLKNNLIFTTCPYCNIHYGKHLTNHMKECSFKGVRKSIDRFIPGTNQKSIFSHVNIESQNKPQ